MSEMFVLDYFFVQNLDVFSSEMYAGRFFFFFNWEAFIFTSLVTTRADLHGRGPILTEAPSRFLAISFFFYNSRYYRSFAGGATSANAIDYRGVSGRSAPKL